MDTQTQFYEAIQINDIQNVKSLLKDKRVDPSYRNNSSIQFASENGHFNIVKLLLKDKRVDPSDNNNWAIKLASQNGHVDILKLLLKDKRVSPSDNNWIIRFASANGHIDIVKLLLKDKRVNPSLKEDYFELYEILIEKDKIQNKIKDFLLTYLL